MQDALNKYLTEEKLDVLGQPLPKTQDNIDWDSDGFSFEFELGLAPEFEVEIKSKKAITQYNIVADSKMIDEQIENIQKQYGKLVSQNTVEKDSEITGTFKNEDHEIENTISLTLDKFKEKSASKKFIGSKVGDVISLETKGLYNDDHDLMHALKVNHDKVHGLDIPVTFTITEINKRELAELDQELFDKLFGKDVVKSVTELKGKIKEDAEKQFVQQADQKFLNDVTEHLVENTKFDLPAEFLQKWLATAGEKELTAEEAAEEYNKSEKGLRYQLIQEKIVKENDIKLDYEELKEGSMWLYSVLNQSLNMTVLGPEEPAISKIRNEFIRTILIKIPSNVHLVNSKMKINKILMSFDAIALYRSIRVNVNVDNY